MGASRGGTTAGPSPSEGRGEEEGELTTLLSATGCEVCMRLPSVYPCLSMAGVLCTMISCTMVEGV